MTLFISNSVLITSLLFHTNDQEVCFFFFLRVLYILTIIFRFFLSHEGTRRARVAGDDQNGPKQSIWLCLGHKYVLFFFLRVFCILTFMYRFFLYHEDTRRVGGPAMTKTSPNDVSGVV